MITNENFWFWFGGIWLAVGLLFLIIGAGVAVSRGTVEGRLDAEGTPAIGVVLTKEIVTPDDGSENQRITFRFSDARGEIVVGTADLAPEAWDALVERGPIQVVYLPDRPQTYRVSGQNDDDVVIALAFSLMGAVLACVGGVVVVNAARTRRRRRQLEQGGALARATVTSVAPANVRINGVSQWKLRYRFEDARGRAHEGTFNVSPEEAKLWQAGSVGRVRYDSSNPNSQLWTGDR